MKSSLRYILFGLSAFVFITTQMSAQTASELRQQLLSIGYSMLNDLSPAERSLYLKLNAPLDEQALAIRLGYDKLVKAGIPPAYSYKELISKDDTKRLLIAGKNEVEKPEGDKDGTPAKKPEIDVDARLRNAGLAFTAGFGVIDGKTSDSTVSTVQVRWNFWQRRATAKWNQLLGESEPDGYKYMRYYGKLEFYDRDAAKPTDVFKSKYNAQGWSSKLPALSFLGLFLGRAVTGEKIALPDGNTERPYIIGASIGLGFYDQAASLAYIDIGTTVSPRRGFDQSRPYAGISLDAVVLAKVLGHLSGSKSK